MNALQAYKMSVTRLVIAMKDLVDKAIAAVERADSSDCTCLYTLVFTFCTFLNVMYAHSS